MSFIRACTMKERATVVTGCMLVGAVLVFAAPTDVRGQQIEVKISTSAIAEKDRAKAVRQFQAQVAKANAQLRRRAGKDRNPLQITSINVVKDCTATINCGGKKLSCSIKGPGTCESGMVSAVCIQSNKSTVVTC